MIKNINEKLGDVVEFETVEEMEKAILANGLILPENGLAENIDYEIMEDHGN